ncbi:MAG: hypothetical protein K2F95_03345 [Alistipes sp.]|nr:hypothetical protein [Alistipes sp.]
MSKRTLFRLISSMLCVVTITLLGGCKEDNTEPVAAPSIELSAQTLEFSAEGGTRQLTIKTNCAWEASAPEWIAVNPSKGSSTPEGVTIDITVGATDAEREAEIAFTAQGTTGQSATKSIKVRQSSAGMPEEPTGDITIPQIIAGMTSQQTVLDQDNDRTLIAVVTTDREGGNFTSKNLCVMTPGATEKGHGLTLYGSNPAIDPSNEAFDLKAGDKIRITFKAGLARIVDYSGLYEVTGSATDEWVSIEKLGSTELSPVTASAEELAQYQAMLVSIANARSAARASEWGSTTSTRTHTFTVGTTPVTVFIQYASPTFVGKYIAPDVTGTLNGVVTVYKGNAQLMPRSIADVEDFVGDGPQEVTSFFYTDFDKEIVNKVDGSWLYCDECDGWKNEKGTGIANLEYEVSGVSPRSNEPSNSTYSDYAGSGGNLILFSSGVTYLSINKIDVGAERNLRLTFGAMRYDMQAEDNRFRKEDLNVQVSLDGGTTWSAPLTYTLKTEGTDHYWSQATCDFTLAQAADNVSIRFTSLTSSTNRIDDVELTAGDGGQTVDGTGADDPTVVRTIAEVIAAANGVYTIEGQVAATYTRGFVVSDSTGAMVVYQGNNPEYVAKTGDSVRVCGVVTEPYYVKQMSYADISLLSAGEYTYAAPAEYDPTKIAEFMQSPRTEYVRICGTMTDASTIVPDGSDITVDMPYLSDGAIDQTLIGKQVSIDAYTIGTDRNRSKITVMLVDLDVAGGDVVISASPEMVSFAPQGGQKSIGLTLYNTDGCTISATTDNAGFSAEVSGDTVVVTAKENTSPQDIEAKLTISAAKGGQTLASTTVRLTQGAAAQEGLITVKMTALDIIANRNGATELLKGAYGNQNVDAVDSWYTWTQFGYDMAGARIGISQRGVIPDCLQMQGNASDTKKMGIIANMNSLGQIVKIVIRTKNESNAPNHTLFVGTECCPSQTSIEATTESMQDTINPDKVTIYVQTYDLSQGNYTFFKMHNNNTGVAYVDSIEITYKK